MYGVYENVLPINSNEVFTLVESGGYLNYIQKTVIDKLGEPYNQCEDNTDSLNSPLANEIKSRGLDYSQNLCHKLCRLYFIQDTCRCSLQYQLWSNGSDTCDKSCVETILDTFDYGVSCESCPIECDSVLYETRMVKGNISRFISDNLNMAERFSNFTFESIVHNLTALNFNYNKMQYTKIREIPRTTFVTLTGELGGTVGKNLFKFLS